VIKIRFVQRPFPRHETDAQLLREFRVAADEPGLEFRVLFGVIASGDEDIIKPARALELREATGALCVAWEGAGQPARHPSAASSSWRCERSPIAPTTPATDFHANLERSMPNLGHLLLKWSLARRQNGVREKAE